MAEPKPVRREAKLTEDELWRFVEEREVVALASTGHDGWPHVMPISFVVLDGTVWGWSYGKAQKVRNLERDPRCTLLFEHGTDYQEMRGAMLRCRVVLHRDLETVARTGEAISARYGGEPDAARALVARQAPKRVALEFVEAGRRVTWDHAKLAGEHATES